jgi:hypothetical protein
MFFEGCARCEKDTSLCLQTLACQVVKVGSVGNVANPCWFGLQNTQSRHAEQTVEVVRIHESGTFGLHGSSSTKVGFVRDVWCFGTRDSEVNWERTDDGDVSGGAPRERIPGETDWRGPVQRSQGALKERPGP